MIKPKILMVINEDRFFLSHRKPIAIAAAKNGFEVIIVTKDTGHRQDIEDLGFEMIDLPIDPTGMNPFEEFSTFNFLFKLYREQKPDIVHHVGLKNILWGGIAAKLNKVPGIVNAVSGLGSIFNGDSLSLTAKIILKIQKFSNNRRNVKVIFQNNDDMSIYLDRGIVKDDQVEFIKGSGIDLEEYKYTPEKQGDKINIIFTARMVKEKGVCDLIEAAESLKIKYEQRICFWLCGRITKNQSGIHEEYMKQHCDGKYICWLGERNDIKELLENSSIMAFPSYYREGVPKSLIEAAAIGRPIITCNSTGCKDVVDDGINGYLISPQTPYELVEKLTILIEDKNMRHNMGLASRKKAVKEFSIDKVINSHLKIYKELVN